MVDFKYHSGCTRPALLPLHSLLFSVSLTSFCGFTFITVNLQSAQSLWVLCVCVCVCFPLLSVLFSSASFLLFHWLWPLSSYLWMNECTIKCWARVASLLFCLDMCVFVCVCVTLSKESLVGSVCVCSYSCLNQTAAPVWVTDPVVSWLQCFYCLATWLQRT